jgi:chromate transport protein ChrA
MQGSLLLALLILNSPFILMIAGVIAGIVAQSKYNKGDRVGTYKALKASFVLDLAAAIAAALLFLLTKSIWMILVAALCGYNAYRARQSIERIL